MGAPIGNRNGAKDKPFEKALRALAVQQPDRVRRIALKLFDAAEAGDMPAVKELFERLDGRIAQRVEATGADGGPIEFADADAGYVRHRLVEIAAGVDARNDLVEADAGRARSTTV